MFSILFQEEKGCKKTAVKEGREGSKAKLERGKNLVRNWENDGAHLESQKNTTEIKAGEEIRDDIILPRDRSMDILARFICAVLLSACPQKVTATDAVPVGVTHIRQTLASQTALKPKDHVFHFYQKSTNTYFSI